MTDTPPDNPVVCAWGGGVDSTAMLVEMVDSGQRVDAVLFADTGSERPETYAFIELFTAWLEARGILVVVVRYMPTNTKNYPRYASLYENCLTNGTLPSITFGGGTCSLKWKVAPQNKWTEAWPPAQRCWAEGGKVTRLIGYDCSPADDRRYAHSRTIPADERYNYRYPLREWGWQRPDCEARIARAGLPIPKKSSCTFCTASKKDEIATLPAIELRRIVLMEARAKPRLRNVDGLWRKRVKGMRGATPRPGSMTEFIREEGLLPSSDIDAIIEAAPQALVRWQEAVAGDPGRPELKQWLDLFDRTFELGLDAPGVAPLFNNPKLARAA